MKITKEKLKQCLHSSMEVDVAKLKKQTASDEPYVFSQKFEDGMQVIIDSVKKKSKRIAMTKIAVDIVAWVKEYFNFKKEGENIEEVAISFDESQMSYIPEGFKKVEEQIFFNFVKYKYINSQGIYFNVKAYSNKLSCNQNDESIQYEIKVSESGQEYSYVQSKEVNVIFWENKDGTFYRLNGNIAINELIMIMDNIRQ